MAEGRASRWNIANAITAVRIVVVPAFAAALLWDGGGNVRLRLVALTIFVLAAATDRLDGWLARRYELITDLGKLLDPIADKLLIGTALVCLSLLGELPWWVTIVIGVREIGITVMRFFLLRYVVLPASRGGKLKTVLQSMAITLFLLPLDHLPSFVRVMAWAVLITAVIVTVVTGLDYVRTAVRVRRAAALPRSGGR